MNKENQENNKKVLPTQAMLFLRGSVGVYLMYLAFDLLKDESMSASRMVIFIFSIIFAVAGAIIVFGIVRTWMRGEFVGGKADVSDDEEYTEYEEDIIGDIPEEKIEELEGSDKEEKEDEMIN